MPGGGVGIFNGCTAEWGAPSSGWGAQYGGISSASDCDSFPEKLKAGCKWRFDWFAGADNPTVSFEQVSCPAALTANTNCVRSDDGSAPSPATPSSSAAVVSKATPTAQISTQAPAASSVNPVVSSSPAAVIVSSAAEIVSSNAPSVSPDTPATTETHKEVVPTPSVTPASSAAPVTTSPAEEEDDDTCEWDL